MTIVKVYTIEPTVSWVVRSSFIDDDGIPFDDWNRASFDVAEDALSFARDMKVSDDETPGFHEVVKVEETALADDELVFRFANALREKMTEARAKGRSGWQSPDWMDECRAMLREHIEKGDPRDVAILAAFLWHHGVSTTKGG